MSPLNATPRLGAHARLAFPRRVPLGMHRAEVQPIRAVR